MISTFYISVIVPVIVPVVIPVAVPVPNRNPNRNRSPNPMPLTLLFSKRLTNDEPFEFPTSVTVDRSLVFDVIDLDIPRRRMAGWLYSSIPSGLGDKEIAEAKRIAFGKNRVRFDTHALPFNLKFYPEYGLKNFDLNVYSGVDRIDAGTPLNAAFVARHETAVRNGVVQYRLNNAATWTTIPGMGGVAQAYYRPISNVVLVRTHQNELFFCVVGTWTWTATDVPTFRLGLSEGTTREIRQVATPQL